MRGACVDVIEGRKRAAGMSWSGLLRPKTRQPRSDRRNRTCKYNECYVNLMDVTTTFMPHPWEIFEVENEQNDDEGPWPCQV